MSSIPGDEPIKYVDSQTSKKDSIQKCFYPSGLHRKSGRYAWEFDHLITNNDSISKEDPDKTPKTSNQTIDLSKVDFKYKIHLPNPNNQQDDSNIDEEND